MLVVYQKYYTPLDRFINNFRRKGFWLYTGLITLSLVYMFYELSHLPDIPPPSPPPSKRNARTVKKKEVRTTDPSTGVAKVEEVVIIE